MGIYLLVACIVNSVGGSFKVQSLEQFGGTLLFPLIALAMIVYGIREHREFRQLTLPDEGKEV
ncbi:hypothetical protein KDW_59450 [Dictyobacter vulcani]|uniref:Uncharacterized protein n=1 Tax=Dictyobacter vulcani TaxID=2607529 RepID=A0A5J4KWB2_9CHLR|nr:hypothetical protein [Dictyobacter vulcani]GER91783.1 hypothetical protein KDW_59450 [Dictyobacter vulcani]